MAPPPNSDNTGQRSVISVSELNRRARQLLETHLPLLWVEGEISNFARPASGHWYFTLKDDKAQVRSAMFRNRNRLVQFQPEEGQQVLVRCRVGLYENRGDYQLIIEHMEPAGLGALQRQFDQLKNKLLDEGLFNTELKLPLPEIPRQIGIITSPTGAALRDILHVLQRRYPVAPINIYPTLVQGKEAADQIVDALELANRHDQCDLLILSRGGGSLEDLWPFNEERVARAVSASAIAVISGVGHETDSTIVDFAADAFAPTPSAAAEMASPDGTELLSVLEGYERWFKRSLISRLQLLKQNLRSLQKRLRHPSERLNQQAQHFDHLEIRLKRAIHSALLTKQSDLKLLHNHLQRQNPKHRLVESTLQLKQLQKQLCQSMAFSLDNCRESLSHNAQLLQAMSPLNTLDRGYAIVQDKNQHVLSGVKTASRGDAISVLLADGSLDCRVEQKHVGKTLNRQNK